MPWDNHTVNRSGLNCSKCYRGPHYNQGWEYHTHYELFKYCQRNPAEQVAYIHTKGSYNPRSNPGGRLRRFVMKGVTSKECYNTTGKCNVCASRFSPSPHPHIPGNMWSAKCSYIQKLANPMWFQQNMSLVYAMPHRPHPQDWAIGANRFAAEHWVGSHPQLEPCDVYAGAPAWGGGYPLGEA